MKNMTVASAIHASDIFFSYEEGTHALIDVNFFAASGEFVAMLASNGSGKTTLIKVLAGLLSPQKGAVKIYGREIRTFSPNELYQKVGIVFQNPNDQLFAATVEEDVAFGPRNLGISEEEVSIRVKEALLAVGGYELHDRAIHHLSFGEQKRVTMAGVLAMKPSVLILDEPTAGLDPVSETLMMRLLNRLNKDEGITVVLATHSVDMLPLFADRIYVLNRGKVLKEGTSKEIFCDHEMIEQASLRLPHVACLLHEMKRYDGVPINGLPLTVRDARRQLLELIPDDLIAKQLERE